MISKKRLAAVTSLALALGAASPAVLAAERIVCKSINARLSSLLVPPEECPSPFVLCTQGTVHNGLLRGETFFTASELVLAAGFDSPPFPVASYTGALRIHTRRGSLTTEGVGIFDPLPPPDGDGTFAQFDRLVGGTGRFEGATGTLYFFGVGNEDGSGFESAVRGEVCLRVHPRGEDEDEDGDGDD